MGDANVKDGCAVVKEAGGGKVAYCLLELAERLESRVMPMALLQLGNISRVQTRLGSKTETKSSEIFVEDY